MNGERSRLQLTKTEAVGRRGLVATKHPEASRAGLEILRTGGNAVDAAVAAALALGVVEPASSGIGGGGYALVARADAVEVVAFPMQAGALAKPERYPLDGRKRVGNFLWDGVAEDANLHGYNAMSVPGAVAGLALLLERHGRLPWRELLQPAIELAREGFELTWFDALQMARSAAAVRRHPELGGNFYVEGAILTPDQFVPPRLRQPELADCLDTLAREGPQAFYQGDIAAAVAADCADHGGVLRRDDLAQYRAWTAAPVTTAYRGKTVSVPGPGCAGPTTIETLNILEHLDCAALGHDSAERLHAFMWAARLAQADRFAYMADPERVPAPWSSLVSKSYAETRFQAIDPERAPQDIEAGEAWAYAQEAHALQRAKSETSTTHLCVADEVGTFVSLTNTVGGAWGSEVVPGGTGIVWNNGMWWFDPVPGRPNSVAPRAFGLNNMSPAIVLDEARPVLAVGASGGRRITNCVAQIIMHVLDHGMGVQAAIEAPRVDASTPWVTVDARFPAATIEALRTVGWDLRTPPYPEQSAFASPTAILRAEDGSLRGGVDVFHSAEARAW